MQKDVITFVTKRVLCLKSFNQHWQMIRTDYSHRYPAQNNLESLRGDNSVHDYPWWSSNFHQRVYWRRTPANPKPDKTGKKRTRLKASVVLMESDSGIDLRQLGGRLLLIR